MMSGSKKRWRHLTYILSLVIHGALAFIFAFITFREDTSTFPPDREMFVELYEEEQPSPEPKRDTRLPGEPVIKKEQVVEAPVIEKEEQKEKLPVADYGEEAGKSPTAPDTLTHSDYGRLVRDLLAEPGEPDTLSTYLNEESPPTVKKPEQADLLRPKAGRFPPLPPIDPKGRGPRERTSTAERLEDHIRGVRRDIMRDRDPVPLTAIPIIAANLLTELFGKDHTRTRKQQKRVPVDQLWSISETDLRILIVLWSNGQFSPDRLTRYERLFLGMSEIQTYSYLEYMKGRGFVSPNFSSGRVFYHANVTRREVINALMARLSVTHSNAEKKFIYGYIELLKACYDYSKKRVTIHE